MASASENDLEAQRQINAPLLESRGQDNRWRIWPHLPRRDTSLAIFLVKSSEALAGGILTLAVLNATHFLSASPKEKEERLKQCFASSTRQPWKALILALPFILYPVTQWISGMAKMAESDRRGLSTVSFAVIVEYILAILASGLLTHCIAEANIRLAIGASVSAVVILLIAWTITFNRPKCLRRLFFSWCCCGLTQDIAAAQAHDQSLAAAELSRQVAIAQEAFAVQVRRQNEAFAASERACEAAEAKRFAKEKAAEALQDIDIAAAAVLASKAEMDIKNLAKEEADRIKQEAETLPPANEQVPGADACQTSPEVGQHTCTSADQETNLATSNYSRIEQEAMDARGKHKEAVAQLKRAEDASAIAKENVVQATQDKDAKKEEYISARQKVVEATTAAKDAYQKAATARSVVVM